MSAALIILAAGKGTRMNSDLPKVLHPIGGAPMLHHAMRAGAALDPEHVIVVAGHGADQVRAAALSYDENAEVVLQEEQLGTGHAVDQARDALKGFEGDIVVLFGDTPFLQPETLERMLAEQSSPMATEIIFTILLAEATFQFKTWRSSSFLSASVMSVIMILTLKNSYGLS